MTKTFCPWWLNFEPHPSRTTEMKVGLKPERVLVFAGESNHSFGLLRWCRISSINSMVQANSSWPPIDLVRARLCQQMLPNPGTFGFERVPSAARGCPLETCLPKPRKKKCLARSAKCGSETGAQPCEIQLRELWLLEACAMSSTIGHLLLWAAAKNCQGTKLAQKRSENFKQAEPGHPKANAACQLDPRNGLSGTSAPVACILS